MFKMFKKLKGQNKKEMVSSHNVYEIKRKHSKNNKTVVLERGADSHLWIFAFLRGY